MKNEIIDAIIDAQAGWTGADWTHEYDSDDDGEIIYCDGDRDACPTCDAAAEDASAAEQHGEAALAHLCRGEYRDALEELQRAVALENDYGDCPTWGPPRDGLAQLIEQRGCECHQAMIHECQRLVEDAEAVELEWMPPWLRASHDAAGNWGTYPANGAYLLRLCPECAEELRETDADGICG